MIWEEEYQLKNKIILLVLLIMISTVITGCLVSDDSTTTMDNQQVEEIDAEVNGVIDDFFKYNQYDPANEEYSDYNVERLLALFNEDNNGAVVGINPIIGSVYEKSLKTLKNELEEQKSLFKAQNNYKLLFEDSEGNPTYHIFRDKRPGSHAAVYYAKFKVFEEFEGKRLLTDNGMIIFELVREAKVGWVIDYMKIDFMELGTVELE